MNKTTLKKKVLYCLEKSEETRNSDISLTIAVWLSFYPETIFKDQGGNPCINIFDLSKIPSQDSIKRVRAIIQNEEHLYLPTNPVVRIKRKINEQEWLEWVRGQKANLTNPSLG